MAQEQKKLVAVIHKVVNGKKLKVYNGDINKISDRDYIEIINNATLVEEQEKDKEYKLNKRIETLETKLNELEHKVKVLEGEE